MLKHLFKLLSMMGVFGSCVVDDSGSGSDIDFESYDSDIDLDQGNNDTSDAKGDEGENSKDVVAPDTKADDEIMARLEAIEARNQALEQEKMLNDAIGKLQSEHKGFDAEAVKTRLKEIHKEDPARAEELNNPLGWENLWLKELSPKEVQNDNISFGRNVDPVDRHEEFMEKIGSGEGLSLDEQARFFA
jgi:uncharacterized protein (UPF0335 family)